MFQLILPFQLELPFDAGGGATSGRAAKPASSGAGRPGPTRAPRAKSKRAELARAYGSLELPIDITGERPTPREP